MRNKRTKENLPEKESPQQSLEEILKTEIQIARKIADAKDEAEKRVDSTRDDIQSFKDDIIDQARKEREKMLADRLDVANKRSQENLAAAKIQSEQFFENGKAFIDEAVQTVIDLVLLNERGN